MEWLTFRHLEGVTAMDQDKADKQARDMLFGKPVDEPRREMSRSRQTVLLAIVGALVVFFAVDYLSSHDAQDPYSRCNSFFSGANCRGQVDSDLWLKSR